MKKTILYTFALAAVLFVSSCKCEQCKHAYLGDTKLCKDDYNSNQDFKDAVTALENIGYDCKPGN